MTQFHHTTFKHDGDKREVNIVIEAEWAELLLELTKQAALNFQGEAYMINMHIQSCIVVALKSLED